MTALAQSTLSRGAFSSERVFRLDAISGEYVGLAPLETCFNEAKVQLSHEQPGDDSSIEGFVSVRVLRNGGDSALVVVPDGEKVEIPQALIA